MVESTREEKGLQQAVTHFGGNRECRTVSWQEVEAWASAKRSCYHPNMKGEQLSNYASKCQAGPALTNCAKQPRKVMYDQSQWLILTITIYILYHKERLGGSYSKFYYYLHILSC